jgi:hypothetical protein
MKQIKAISHPIPIIQQLKNVLISEENMWLAESLDAPSNLLGYRQHARF